MQRKRLCRQPNSSPLVCRRLRSFAAVGVGYERIAMRVRPRHLLARQTSPSTTETTQHAVYGGIHLLVRNIYRYCVYKHYTYWYVTSTGTRLQARQSETSHIYCVIHHTSISYTYIYITYIMTMSTYIMYINVHLHHMYDYINVITACHFGESGFRLRRPPRPIPFHHQFLF